MLYVFEINYLNNDDTTQENKYESGNSIKFAVIFKVQKQIKKFYNKST